MGSGFVLVHQDAIGRLCQDTAVVQVSRLDYFGDDLWLAHVRSGRIPLGWPKMLELVTWDTDGPVPTRFKPWIDV